MESLQTPFCRALGLTAPVVQAPIGSATTPELAAAVSNAGGLGTIALSWAPPKAVRDMIRATRALTDRPFAVNLILEWDQHVRLHACVEESVDVVSTFWGDPAPYADAIQASGALHVHTVGCAEEALRAVDAGVDVIVAQGWEAGGRVRGEVATLALVPAVVDAITPAPVIAAGGVADGRGLAAVLALGAQAAWVGTRFLLAREASVHAHWRGRIRDARETSTVHSTLFDRGWPHAPHRTLRNSTVRAWEGAGRPDEPNRPGEGGVIAHGPDGKPLYRYGPEPPAAGTTGDVEALALYAGQSAGLVKELLPAADIVDELVTGAVRALAGPNPTGPASRSSAARDRALRLPEADLRPLGRRHDASPTDRALARLEDQAPPRPPGPLGGGADVVDLHVGEPQRPIGSGLHDAAFEPALPVEHLVRTPGRVDPLHPPTAHPGVEAEGAGQVAGVQLEVDDGARRRWEHRLSSLKTRAEARIHRRSDGFGGDRGS